MKRVVRVQLLRMCNTKNICFLCILPIIYYILISFVGAHKWLFSFTGYEFCSALSEGGGTAFVPFLVIILSGIFTTSLWKYNIVELERISGITERDIILGNTITISMPVSIFTAFIFSLLIALLSVINGFGYPDMHIFVRLIAFFIATLCVSNITVLCSFICKSGTSGSALAVFIYFFMGIILGFTVTIVEHICGNSLQIFRSLIPLYNFMVMLDAPEKGVSANVILYYSIVCFIVHSFLLYFISIYTMKKLRRK